MATNDIHEVHFDKIERPQLAKHDSGILDLAFAMDCTGSMGSYIANAQQNIRKISEEIVANEKSDMRFALIEYRDHPPQEHTFVTRVHDFTRRVPEMKDWLDQCSATGGGDRPEAVADALHQILKLSWREEATKICVFIADAPPHGLGDLSDGFPKGCPDGLDPIVTTREITQKGITLYTVGCEPAINRYKDFFMAMAHMTGGQYVPLGRADLLAKVIIGGAQEEISLQQLIADVNTEVEREFNTLGHEVDEEELSNRIHDELKTKGVRSKQMYMNSAPLPEASHHAKKMSSYDSMETVRNYYVTELTECEPKLQSMDTTRMFAKRSAPLHMSKAVKSDDYHVVEQEIDLAQVKRVTNRCLNKQKFKK